MIGDEAIDFPEDCKLIQDAFAKEGYEITLQQADHLWREHSERYFAGWTYLSPVEKIFKELVGLWNEV